MTTCNICCEKFNKSVRAPVECMHCEFSACRECCQTYILGETMPKCINASCGKEWTRKFLRDSFTAAFINGPLKEWRENLLVDREKALLPATQIYAEAKYRIKAIDTEQREIDRVIAQLTTQRNLLIMEKHNLTLDPTALAATESEGVIERRQFMQPCSVDDCRGYLSTQWKCGLCSTWTCPECHEVIGQSKETAHTCDPNNVETARMLKKETKPCPKCAASIFKIDGCDQIWCTQCHTAFSWKTGNIETKIHNPHYYEWLRNTQGAVPRDPLDVPGMCDNVGLEVGREMLRRFDTVLRNQHAYNSSILHTLHDIFPNIIHMSHVEIHPDNYEARNRELRIKFLTKEIDEKQLKIKLQQGDKKHSKERDIQNVYEMVVAASTDILRRFLRHVTETRTAVAQKLDTSILNEIIALSKYANDCLGEVQYVHGGEVMQLMPNLKLIHIESIYEKAFNKMGFNSKVKFDVFVEKCPELKRKVDAAQNKCARAWACWDYAMSK